MLRDGRQLTRDPDTRSLAGRSSAPRPLGSTTASGRFNDSTRTLPLHHDVTRRVECGFLAGLMVEHRLDEGEVADIAYKLVKQAHKL